MMFIKSIISQLNPLYALTFFLITFGNAFASPSQPNIIFILLDDAGFGELQWYPDQQDISSHSRDQTDVFSTPDIFQLAQEGVRFTNYHSPASICSPARAGIITGRYPSEFAIRDFLNLGGLRGLPAGTPTIATILRDQGGYTTGHFGKWNLGNGSPEHLPVHFGFDESMIRFANGPFDSYQGSTFIDGDDLAGRKVVAPFEHSTTTLTNRAMQFMNSATESGKPYFLNLWYRAPHVPLDPPALFPNEPNKDVEPGSVYDYEGDWPETWSKFIKKYPQLAKLGYLENHSPTSAAKSRAKYIAMLAWLDHEIGRVIEAADALDPSGNTLIVLTSDNGGHRTFAHGNGDEPATWKENADLREGKRALYEGGIDVPLIIRWKAAHLATGKTNDSFLVGMDFLPTFADIGNIDIKNQSLPGKNILSALIGAGEAPSRSEPVFWESMPKGALFGRPDTSTTMDDEQYRYAVWDETQRRKLVMQRDKNDGMVTRLFDIDTQNSSGVNEDDVTLPQLNLASREPETVDLLEQAYRAWRMDIGMIDHTYDLSRSTGQIDDEKVSFSSSDQVVTIAPNDRLLFRESDFSFQSYVQLESTPAAAGAVVAEHQESWRLWLEPGSKENTVTVHAAFTASTARENSRPGSPGDTVELKAETPCTIPCQFDVAFTVLGVTGDESSVRLYVDGSPRDEFRANPQDDILFSEIYASKEDPVFLGNDENNNMGVVGRLVAPTFYNLSLSPAEVNARRLEAIELL